MNVVVKFTLIPINIFSMLDGVTKPNITQNFLGYAIAPTDLRIGITYSQNNVVENN
ncbi:hypothetical protein [Nostoc sp. FACHB-280]|uniref:hypothetical protein n=1 Tax=Nostoc sp. FACHB-280 TaxID=2692839 RepID=UPI0019C288FB|nr:hypothetical protein [Nostoc sp. FACHB-280]MBD2495434.1 hypothetical protein [Nostoc sp. FACHB-280]